MIEGYKPSIFNRVVEKNGEMVLYNSMTGSYGIKRVSEENQEEVRNLLYKANCALPRRMI